MKKLGILVLTVTLVFGLSFGVLARVQDIEDGEERDWDVDVDVTVESAAEFINETGFDVNIQPDDNSGGTAYMPTWLKCRDCGAKYYTARSEYSLNDREKCEKCGGDLARISNDYKKVLSEDLLVEFKVTGESETRARTRVAEVDRKSIETEIVDGENFKSIIRERLEVEVNFSRSHPHPGRFQFYSSVEEIEEETDEEIVSLKAPEYLYKNQERKAPRFPVDGEVEFQPLDQEKSLEKEVVEPENESMYEGKAVDISVSGIMFLENGSSPVEMEEDQPVYLRLEFEGKEFEVAGRVARVAENAPVEAETGRGFGVEFEDLPEKGELMIQELQMKQL